MQTPPYITSNPQPKPYRIFSAIYFSLIGPKSRYIFTQENRTFRKAFLMMSASQKVRKYAALAFIFLTANRPSQRGSVVQRKTYSTPIVQGNGGTHFFLKI